MLTYLFWPNPPASTYDHPQIVALLVLCISLLFLSFGMRRWRSLVSNAVTRRLTRSWSSLFLWFGLIGLVLVVARVERIQYISMRFWWIVWGIAAILSLLVQVRQWRSKHYEILPVQHASDPRDKYLPQRKRK